MGAGGGREQPCPWEAPRAATAKGLARNRPGGFPIGPPEWAGPWTGSRVGSIRSAQWVGGGKIHTPRPRDYTKAMPRKMRRAALRSALSVKASQGAVVLVDGMKMEQPKTRAMAEAFQALAGEETVLLLLPGANSEFANASRSAGNLANAKVLNANYLNVRDLLGYDKLVLPVEALDVIRGYLGQEEPA